MAYAQMKDNALHPQTLVLKSARRIRPGDTLASMACVATQHVYACIHSPTHPPTTPSTLSSAH